MPRSHLGLREKPWSKMDLFQEADRYMSRRFAPAGVLINQDWEILQFRGETEPYLKQAAGEASFSLMKMAREGLAAGLHSALQESRKQNRQVKRENLRLEHNGLFRNIDVEVVPLKLGPGGERYFLVLFEEARETITPPPPETEPVAEAPGPEGQDGLFIRQLREELAATKEYLQTAIEDLESRNEEMQAAHVETLSLNEEFQSVNEELETAKEELQSANEELTTMNDELLTRNAELTQMTNDYRNLLASSRIPILMLDPNLKVRLITPAFADTFNLFPADIGKSVKEINLRVRIANLEERVQQVMETLQDHFQEVQDQAGHWYALHIRPYRSMENKIEGAVIALVDIDELKRSFFQLEESRHYAQTVVAAMRESMVLLDRDLRIKMANPSFYETFHVSPQETEGRFFYELGNRQWDIPELREILGQVVSQGNSFQNYLVEHEFPGIGLRTMLLNCSPAHGSGVDELILLTIADLSDLKKAEESYKESAERLKYLTVQLITAQEQERQHIGKELHDDLGQLLAVLKMRLRSVHRRMDALPLETRDDLESALNFVNEIIAGVRYLSRNMRPPVLDLGLPKALKILFEEFSKYHGLELTMDLDDIKDLFSWETQILIYRIFQESLTNVAKHAGATEVAVSIKRRDGTVFFQLEDNGSGFDLQQVLERNDSSRGIGLAAMDERVRMLGGTLNISSQEGKGTKISFAIPTGEDKLVG